MPFKLSFPYIKGHPRQKSIATTAHQGISGATSHAIGCETLFDGVAPVTADIVFVHGLHGHQTGTWTKDNVCWPKDFLQQEDYFSHTRVLAFGYDANISNFVNEASKNTLFEHSQSLLSDLARKREGNLDSRPILFVAHSLGGLLVKDALHYSYMMIDTQPHLAATFKATKGIIFLGTPHRGSEKAAWPKIIQSIGRITLNDANESLLHDLERNSQTLDRIGANFSIILSKRTFYICSFTEELPIKDVGKVVETDSAVIGDAYEMRDSIHANHTEMVRFLTRDERGYQAIIFAMKKLLVEAQQKKIKVTLPKQTSTGTFDNIPHLRVPHFVPRKSILNSLRESFHRTASISPSIAVLIGMGGSGKTQLALDYCQCVKAAGNVQAIFWIDSSSLNSAYRAMELIAKWLSPERKLDSSDAAVSLVRDVLSRWDDEWLMVFDNLDNPMEIYKISSFFPDGGCGSILVTSRYAGAGELGRVIEVFRMEEAEGLQLLLGSRAAVTEKHSAAQDILEILGYLPLAIDQARAYIAKTRLPLTHFFKEYEKRKGVILQETPKVWHYRKALQDEEEMPLNVCTTWEMSLSLLGTDSEHRAILRDVLTLFAFFYPANISEKLFHYDREHDGWRSPMSIFMDKGKWDHLAYEAAIIQMQELSLLQFSRQSQDEIVISLHSMVSEWLRIRLPEELKRPFLGVAVLYLDNYIESADHNDFRTRADCLAHINVISTEDFLADSDRHYGFCWTFAGFYRDCGLYSEAEKMLRVALAGNEKAHGPDHPSTLEVISNLGSLHSDQGRLAEAEQMYERALAGKEKALGPDHPSTLNTVNNLGGVYADQGRLVEAEKLYVRALVGKEKALGPDHASMLNTANNLGLLYYEKGNMVDAEKMYDLALAGKEKVLGMDHPSTLDTVNNLGFLYAFQSRLTQAEKMLERALAGYEKTLGPDHPSTLNAVNNLGLLYRDQGHLASAEKMLERALTGSEQALGRDHATTLSKVTNLGILYQSQGRLAEAEELYERAIAGYEKALGPAHPSTLDAVNSLGILYAETRRLAEAEALYERALAGKENALGPDHPSTLDTINNLGALYTSQSRSSDAEKLFERALAGYNKTLGPEHPSTLQTLDNLRLVRGSQGSGSGSSSSHQRFALFKKFKFI